MDKAVNRLESAFTNEEKILVYGDYDVDGTTSVAMMFSFIRKYNDKVDYYIPDRYTEGYGISFKGIDYAIQHKVSLIIALDCGIKAVDKVLMPKNIRSILSFVIIIHRVRFYLRPLRC